jgi:hypothetical protein
LRSVNLDADWPYRAGIPRAARAAGRVSNGTGEWAAAVLRGARAPLAGVGGHWWHMARSVDAALWAGALLAGYLLIYFVTWRF